MNKVYYCKKISSFFIELFLISILLKAGASQLLDNIIRLGNENFRYSHFNFNSNGDMVVDTSSYPVSTERRFFGLKKNGHFYFNSNSPYFSLPATHFAGRIEGESSFIKYSDINYHELIIGIPKKFMILLLKKWFVFLLMIYLEI